MTSRHQAVPRSVLYTIKGRTQVKKNGKQLLIRRGRPAMVSKAAYLAWERSAVEQLRWQFSRKQQHQITTPIRAHFVVYLGARQRPDSDNIASGPFDALEKSGILKNDYLIDDFRVQRKRDNANPRVEIYLGWSE